MSHATQTTYLDNCGTTMMPPNVITAMVNWCNKGNPSSSYPSARAANTMLEAFRARLREIYGDYHVIFTSGASESNCTAIQCITSAYAEATGRRPHVIVGAVEHKSVLATIENLENRATWLDRSAASNEPINFTAQWNDDVHHVLAYIVSGEGKKLG